ncbi:M55 family metallopeptidase [Aminipila luticellarii]|uniref:Peptidase M55 n=1 Tax=Aminipila luticellarii TaxID=2507160 RepID=A0A410PVL7_9FIRM|nr:M55 family metallopeptidase [Aminipila luticellarii]QAT42977.1 peptidase M55 [Aminipila luticellarii]
MKVFISADIEGVTGVTSWGETRYGGQGYEAACRQMTLEVAAACRAAMKLGYEVVVKDGHEDALNIDMTELPKGVQLIRGWMSSPASMMGGLDESFDAVVYIGYHSPEGTDTSSLAHTGEHEWFNYIKINGELASEFLYNALLATDYKVPSVFLSGDEGMCQLAKKSHPEIITVATKKGIGNASWNIHPEEAIENIEAGVEKALKANVGLRPVEKEYHMVINFKEHQHARRASWYPGAKQTDSNTVEYTAKTIWELTVARMFLSE